MGNNLPPPSNVVALFKKYGVGLIKLFDPNPSVLQELRGSQIVASLVFEYITEGNEVIPGEYAGCVCPRDAKLQNILNARHLARISVTTVVSMALFQTSYPPSSCAFSAEARGTLVEVLKFLSAQASPLMVNVYPYFAYAADPANVQIDYALFTAPRPVVRDGA
ncbi:probable glucan endo-1,3-beta-glucosidase BG4 [Actinidia eriantha]|uniref:probable glucan endo-1,3-beta-glucosidase BG4 n=1 Tax=Actinidia eriantha TaxID=165200 RepID=UPI002588A70F|nr:probable glucan endo-1,3-beta-glucosidase BG4 [Actinidia eriantha]